MSDFLTLALFMGLPLLVAIVVAYANRKEKEYYQELYNREVDSCSKKLDRIHELMDLIHSLGYKVKLVGKYELEKLKKK